MQPAELQALPHQHRARMLVKRRLFVSTCLLLSACYSKPAPMLVERPAADPAGIGGDYCYRSPALNVRDANDLRSSRYWQQKEMQEPGTIDRRLSGGFSGIPIRQVRDSSLIEIDVSGSVLVVTYQDDLRRMRRTLRLPITGPVGGEVRIDLPNRSIGVPLGIGTSKRWMTLTRGFDGTLVYIEWYREIALAFFVLPMHETTASTVVFDPATTFCQSASVE